MRNYSVYTKKIRDFDFSKFPSPNRKKIRASRDWCKVAHAKELREEASTILFEQFRSNKYDDSHCYHIYCAGEYKWLLQWVTDIEELRQNLTSLLKICQEAVKKNPYNKIINYVHDTVSRAHLLVGLNRQVEIPTLMDDLDNSK
ncbi:MAG: hypothetical protein WAZ98_03970 [Cyclobacteriaceae bacterium]